MLNARCHVFASMQHSLTMEIDTSWFVRLIKESRFGSLRQLAPKLRARSGKPMDVAALSRMLSGEREMVLDEARQLANLLGVPMGEVIRRAGVPFGIRDNVEKRAERRSVE